MAITIFKRPGAMSAAIYLFLCFINILVGLKLNGGIFAYSLDDPYIHLALAENIARGHYGVNLQEFSAPSSSIVWPYLLALFSGFSWFEYIPLVLNIICSVLCIVLFEGILDTAFKKASVPENYSTAFKTIAGIAFIFSANLIALTFSGMEHVLQVLCSMAIITGVIQEVEKGDFPAFAVAAIILAPAVRYENAVLSACAILFLFYRKYYKTALIAGIIITLIVAGFSLYLYSLELGFVPTSIVVKSRTAWQSNKLLAVFKIVFANIVSRQGTVLLGLMLMLLKPALTRAQSQTAAIICVVSILFHIIFGDCSVGRYTNYLIATAILVLIYSYAQSLRNFILTTRLLFKTVTLTVLSFFIGAVFIAEAAFMPVALNNIYEQQYQMGRFVREFYKKPVAVNDLGLVSFKNDGYVLDLWGLASKSAFQARTRELLGEKGSEGWMNTFAQRHNVKFAMIYDTWFPAIPANWTRVAQLHLSRQKITPAEKTVQFYSLDPADTPVLTQQLRAFKTTLPPRVHLDIPE